MAFAAAQGGQEWSLAAINAAVPPHAWGLLLGFVAVQALNVVRVISLFYLGQWNTEWFTIAHEFLWQGLIMLDVLVVWLLWVRASPEPAGDTPALAGA
jgi:exosortase H (IPTLxxWG-CTERM-specific)